jgi:IS30 family transposase
MRRARGHTQKTLTHGRICNTLSISERPPSVEDRAVPGHWEGDLLFGSNNSQVVTLVERQTRYLMIAKVCCKIIAARKMLRVLRSLLQDSLRR